MFPVDCQEQTYIVLDDPSMDFRCYYLSCQRVFCCVICDFFFMTV